MNVSVTTLTLDPLAIQHKMSKSSFWETHMWGVKLEDSEVGPEAIALVNNPQRCHSYNGRETLYRMRYFTKPFHDPQKCIYAIHMLEGFTDIKVAVVKASVQRELCSWFLWVEGCFLEVLHSSGQHQFKRANKRSLNWDGDGLGNSIWESLFPFRL